MGTVCLLPSCPHYLDKKACERCQKEALGCEQCGNEPAKLIRINSRPIWRPNQNGRCLGCATEALLDMSECCRDCNNQFDLRLRNVVLCGACSNDYAKICSSCGENTDVYAENSLECPTCFYGDAFFTETTKTKICSSCGQPSHLNSQGECRNCFVEQAMANANNDDWGTTKVCPECRKITLRGRKVCTSCSLKKLGLKTCMGCTTKFKTISKYDTFCLPCKEHMQRGVCTSCSSELREGHDEHGWCPQCQLENKP